MKNDKEKALACLDCLPCAALSYSEWLQVGMALEHSGCSWQDWDQWSRTDTQRYQEGLCQTKWKSFRGHTPPVTLGTLIELCRQHGTVPEGLWDFDFADTPSETFDWGDVLPRGAKSLAPEWVQPEEVPVPAPDWSPMDLARYLEAMFQPEERVGLCVEAWKPEGKEDARWLPKKGVYDRTAGTLIELIHACKGDLGAVIGDTNPEAGAWIRINPLDGNGVRDENVTVLRHALLEADDGDVGRQLALIHEMKIPVSSIVHSGGKSIHALVRVDAKDMQEYRQRVDYLYKVAGKYGLKLDAANRNPSRLSRMPGVSRNGKPQYMISGAAGMADWKSWVDYVEDLKDDLPDPIDLEITNLPARADVIIDGTLRKGRKMMLTGPSKAGKTWTLMNLCSAIANGSSWLGMPVAQGKVMYLNLELAEDECAHRFRDVWQANGYAKKNLKNVRVWNLRGHSTPLDKLAPKLIRRCDGGQFSAIVIDPIYKVTTGDENDAAAMSHFCNQLDKIALRLQCAVIYGHHHSKGAQGQKRAMDRASGSGVLARDADALIDMIELELTPQRREILTNNLAVAAIDDFIAGLGGNGNNVDEQERGISLTYLPAAQRAYPKQADAMREAVAQAYAKAQAMSGWRIERTLREFPFPKPHRIWFAHPTHVEDKWELLLDAKAAGEEPPWKAAQKEREQAKADKGKELQTELEEAIEGCGGVNEATVADVANHLGLSDDATRNRIRKHPKFAYKAGLVVRRKRGKSE
jgi:RecA-family ATPase